MTDTKRAPPRTRRKDPTEAPIFLEKTFQMVSTTDPAIVGWSPTGDTFIVKNLEEFCNTLPMFFKHRNFRSFVRQLNFYGFRKLRSDTSETAVRPAGWWEFKHPQFLIGRGDLLPVIKRAEHYVDGALQPAASSGGSGRGGGAGEEAAALRTKVASLEGQVSTMGAEIEQLTGLVEALLTERATGIRDGIIPPGVVTAAEALSKKRKVGSGSGSSGGGAFLLGDVPSMPPPSSSSSSSGDMVLDLTGAFGDALAHPELEVDEAAMLSQLSIGRGGADEGAESDDGVGAMASAHSFVQPGALSFDFSDGVAVDAGDQRLSRQGSASSAGSGASLASQGEAPVLNPEMVASFFTGMADFSAAANGAAAGAAAAVAAALPAEPHLAEGRPLMRTTSQAPFSTGA